MMNVENLIVLIVSFAISFIVWFAIGKIKRNKKK